MFAIGVREIGKLSGQGISLLNLNPQSMLAIVGINNPIEIAILFGIVGGIFATLRQITKAREAKQTKHSIDELQKRIGELTPDATEEQFRAVLDNWERGK
jgi:hypothetical protein